MSKPESRAEGPAIMWFRQDLRLTDNPALRQAVESGRPVLPVFIFDEISPDIRKMGAAQKWWLHHSLKSLLDDLGTRDTNLIIRNGPADDVLDDLIGETNACSVFWNRRYGGGEIALDTKIKSSLTERGIEVKSFASLLMHEPAKVKTQEGNPYKVFTPFWKAFSATEPPRELLPRVDKIDICNNKLDSIGLDELGLLPTNPDWSGGMAKEWEPGEKGANDRLRTFLKEALESYADGRDIPGKPLTSKLSPHLRFGEISPYQIWDATRTYDGKVPSEQIETYRKELIWREFSYHLLFDNPDLHENNFQKKFDIFPWEKNEKWLAAWQRGQTGYPIVDAGMRQLWKTGWMHNRVRMIVGSFLVKHLLIDWREGERWFWDTLVDGDPASNPAQWQWVAGTGADAAPYFRVFNPMLQGDKFDGDGVYVRRWVPEIANLPDEHIHRPWEAPSDVLEEAGLVLGEAYPEPLVNHKQAREKALDALNGIKEKA